MKNTHKITLLLVLALVLGAGFMGWRLGRSDRPLGNQPISTTQSVDDSIDTPDVKSLVSYTLLDGWKEARCPSPSGSVYVLPAGSSTLDCDANPSSPVKISVDQADSKDCNQLQNVQNVKKHVCISLYINGHKSLKASTEHLASSSYNKATTVNAYYIDTGKGVVKLEYIYNTDSQFQAGFDQLANSIKVKA